MNKEFPRGRKQVGMEFTGMQQRPGLKEEMRNILMKVDNIIQKEMSTLRNEGTGKINGTADCKEFVSLGK
jgi:hypothetical protein